MNTTWITPAQQVRACFFCTYSTHAGDPTAARCNHPHVTHSRGPQPLHETRSSANVLDCGPDSRHFKHINPCARIGV